METKGIYSGRTLYPCGRAVGKSTDVLVAVVTVTRSQWEETRRCVNCGHERRSHMEDGYCLFEPTQFKAEPPPHIDSDWGMPVETMTASYTVERSMNHGPAPRIPKHKHKEDVRRTFKAPRPPKARR